MNRIDRIAIRDPFRGIINRRMKSIARVIGSFFFLITFFQHPHAVRLLDQLSNNFNDWEFIKENEGIKHHHKANSS